MIYISNAYVDITRSMIDKQLLDRIPDPPKAALGLLVLLLGLANYALDLLDKLRTHWEFIAELPTWSQLALTFFICAFAFYLLWLAIKGKSRLLRPERFIVRPETPGFLIGREPEVNDLGGLCIREQLIFLFGESGCGKSALVRGGLVPWCEQGSGRPLPIVIDLAAAPWDQGVSALLGRSLWIEHKDACELIGYKNYPSSDEVFDILIKLEARTARIPLLIFDQFDDYQTAYHEKFYSNGSVLLKVEEFLRQNKFWHQVASHVRTEHCHCLFVSRDDTSASLDALKFCESRTFLLQRIQDTLIEPLFDKITASSSDDLPVVEFPDRGWNQLRRRLLNDLSIQNARILPIQLAIALDSIRHWRFLTVAQYRKQGELAGLERLHIEDRAQKIGQECGITTRLVIEVLMSLTDRDGKKTLRQGYDELIRQFPGLEPNTLSTALERLEQSHVVRRRVPDPAGSGSEIWFLYHDYLARGVIEAHRALDRWRLYLHESFVAWQRSDGWRERWRALLPVKTQVRLWWELLLRRLPFDHYRNYMTWSILRFAPWVMGILIALTIYDWSESQRDYNLAQTVIAALDENREFSEREAVQFLRLLESPWRARRAAINYALENTDASHRALQHIEMLTHAVVGLDSTGNHSSEILDIILGRLGFLKPGEPSANLAMALIPQLRVTSFETLANKLIVLMKTQRDQSVQITMIQALQVVATNLETEGAENITQELVKLIKTSRDHGVQRAILLVFQTVGSKLRSESVASVLKELAALPIIENDDVKESMNEALQALISRLEPDDAETIFNELNQRLKNRDNLPNRRVVAMVFSSVSNKLTLNNPEQTYTDLVGWIKTETDQFVMFNLIAAIHAISRNVGPADAARIAKDLLNRTEAEEKLLLRRAFAGALPTVSRQLDPQYAHEFFKELIDLAQSEQDRSVQNSVIVALETVARRLEAKNAEQRSTEVLALLKPRQQFSIRRRLPMILQTLSARIGVESAEVVFKNLVGQLRIEWDVPVWQALPEALREVANKLEEKNAHERFRELLQLAKSKPDTAFRRSLTSSLHAVSNKIYPSNAERAFKELIEYIKAEDDDSISKALAGVTALLGAKLESNSAEKMFDYLLELLKNERRNHVFRRSLPTALRAVASRFEANIAEIKFNALVEITKKEEDNVRRSLVEVLSTMARKINAEHTEIKLKQSMDWIKTEQDSTVQTAMIDLLRVLGDKLEPKSAEAVAKEIIDRMKSQREGSRHQVWANVLEAVGSKLDSKTAESLSRDLVELIKNERGASNVEAMAGALRAVSTNLDPPILESVLLESIALLENQKDRNIFQAVSSRVIKSLEKQMPTNNKSVNARLQNYVNLLKGYRGGIPSLRSVILANVEIINGQSFEGDKWKFVNWATGPSAAKFRLDLD